MRLVDTHAHLAAADFADDLGEVLQRARDAGVVCILCVADDLASAVRGLELAAEHPQLRVTAGIHPHKAGTVGEPDFAELERIVASGRVAAVGEIGLDFHYDFAPRARQIEVFRRQIGIALKHRLPVVLHSRSAEAEVLRILEEEGASEIGGVMHCFWGDAEALQTTLRLGFFVGVGGPVTFKSAEELRALVRTVPVDRILLETDSPYLAPVPYRGKRNEPAYVAATARRLAEVLSLDVEELAERTTANADRLFRLRLDEQKSIP